MDELERQKRFFQLKYPSYELVADIGSGLNWKRKGLQTLLERAMCRDIEEIVVAHKDRLCRFAYELVKLVVLNKSDQESSSQELVEDIMSIIHVYSCTEIGKKTL